MKKQSEKAWGHRDLLIVMALGFLFSALMLFSLRASPNAESKPVIVGILVWAVIITIAFLHLEQREPESKANAEDKKSWDRDKFFLLEYKEIRNGIRSRDRLTIIAGSIMVSASLVLLGTLVDTNFPEDLGMYRKFLLVTAILALYSIWFICFNLTSGKVNSLQYERLRQMEEYKKLRMQRYMIEHTWLGNSKWFRYARRPVWLYFFYVLTVASISILLLS